MATFKDGVYHNVELKAYIDSNQKHAIGDILFVEGPQHGYSRPLATVRVIHRKAQLGNPMGNWKYLVEFVIGGHDHDIADVPANR